jgi:hypothetical protein
MLCILGTIFVLSHIFSCCLEENFCRYLMGMTEKARRAVAFLSLVNSEPLSLRIDLILPYMLGLDSGSFP